MTAAVRGSSERGRAVRVTLWLYAGNHVGVIGVLKSGRGVEEAA